MKLRSYSLRSYVFAVAAYIVFSLFIPLDSTTRAAYNFSLSQAHIVAFITALPLFGVWFVAFYCYGKLHKYVDSIHKAREAAAFSRIADGVMVLSWGLVIQAFAALLLGGLSGHIHGFYGAAAVIENYIKIVFTLIAFTFISSGARQLLTTRHGYATLPSSRWLILLFAIIASIYSYLAVHVQDHSPFAHHLPIALLFITVIIPYIYSWFLGLLAAFDITIHAKVTHGVLYRRSLNELAGGLICLIISSIIMQYLNSAFAAKVGAFSINAVLLIDYFLLFGMAFGYVLMINGVRGLQRIEEI